jgi:ATP-dependent DNA helicase PIF1
LIILVGDPQQLPPVLDTAVYRKAKGVAAQLGARLCMDITWTIMLTESKRMEDDKPWAELCARLAVGKYTNADWQALQERSPHRVEDRAKWDDAVLITYLKADVRVANTAKLAATSIAGGNDAPIARISAVHSCRQAAAAPPADAYGLSHEVCICVGARVMVNNNLSVKHGVTNGAFGTVVRIVYRPGVGPPALPVVVLVELDEWRGGVSFTDDDWLGASTCGRKNVVPIVPLEAKWYVGGTTLTRLQLPLRLAWAFTVHKSQGSSHTLARVNIGPDELALGHSLVAISRLRTMEGQPTSMDSLTLSGISAEVRPSRAGQPTSMDSLTLSAEVRPITL